MSGLTYRENHRVKTYECDVKQQMTLPALISVMLETSGRQSHFLGNTDEQMSSHGLSWIIIQYQMEIKRMPQRGEELQIETEAISYNRFFTYRKFRAFDLEDNLLVEVLTVFSMMEIESRKIARIRPELVEMYQAEEVRSLVRLPKIEAVEEADREQSFLVRYLDIDGNQHVNNAKYFDWMINTLEKPFHETHELESVSIKYEKEISYGTTVNSTVSIEELEEGRIRTRHAIENEGSIACSANFTWKK